MVIISRSVNREFLTDFERSGVSGVGGELQALAAAVAARAAAARGLALALLELAQRRAATATAGAGAPAVAVAVARLQHALARFARLTRRCSALVAQQRTEIGSFIFLYTYIFF